MSITTDNFALTEPDSQSDSDWLDIASTDRDSDDNDSIYSSRETDHEDLSRPRSRRSSFSYGSSRDGDVDAWEGLIEDSADGGMPNDVLAPNPHVSSHPDSNHTQETSPEELRVKEGLDQSMVSTLSSSRSSSFHASTVLNSSRDLRLSFPDPITSSCREPLSTSYEEIETNSNISPVDSDAPCQVGDEGEEMPQMHATPHFPLGLELKVFLYGFPNIFKYCIVNTLLQKVASAAGLTLDAGLEDLQGSVRRLTVSGSFQHDFAFPRIITVVDRTFQPDNALHDPALMDFSGIRPLAVVFTPCRPLYLPEHALCLPISVPSYSSELPDVGNVETGSLQYSWDMLNISNQQLLRITAGSAIIDKDSVMMIPPPVVYRAFSRLWSGDNVSKGIMASTHALTIIAILSLILGLVVRAALPVSLQQFTSPTITTFTPNSSYGSIWQMLRPPPHRERISPSTTADTSVMVISSSSKDFSVSVFNTESTSMTLSRANPTDLLRITPSTLLERERPKSSKDLMLQPPCSVLPPDNRPKALSVIPETNPTTSYQPGPDTIEHAISIPMHPSVPVVVKECASVVITMMNQDMQDIFDALDALVQAISRQTQVLLAQATTFIEQSATYLEKGVESFETLRETLHEHNERARTRAKEIKEKGNKWLYDASEVVTTSARFSTGMAMELAEGLAHRAQRARGKAKEMAVELQDFLNEHDRVDALGLDVWQSHWDEWVMGVRQHWKKSCKRKLKKAIFC